MQVTRLTNNIQEEGITLTQRLQVCVCVFGEGRDFTLKIAYRETWKGGTKIIRGFNKKKLAVLRCSAFFQRWTQSLATVSILHVIGALVESQWGRRDSEKIYLIWELKGQTSDHHLNGFYFPIEKNKTRSCQQNVWLETKFPIRKF